MATTLYFTGLGLLVPELPRLIAGPLHHGDSAVGASVAVFSAAAVAGRVPLFRFGDRVSPRVMLTAGAALGAAGDLLLAANPSLPSVFTMRVLGGLGDALFYTAAMAVVIGTARTERMTRAVARLTTCLFAGLLAGPVAGEAIRGAWGFRPVWWTAAAVTVAAAAVSAGAGRTAVPDSHPSSQPPAGEHGQVALAVTLYVIASVGLAAFFSYLPLYAGRLGQRSVAAEFVVLNVGTALTRLTVIRLIDRAGQRATAIGLLCAESAGLLTAATWRTAAGLIVAAALLAAAQAFGLPVFVLLATRGQQPAGRTRAVAAVTAGFDVGYGAAAAGLGPVAGRAGYPAMFGVAATVALCGALLATRAGPDKPQLKGKRHDRFRAVRGVAVRHRAEPGAGPGRRGERADRARRPG